MRTAMFAVVLPLLVMLSGCATIIKGTTQSVSLKTPPADGAQCELKNSEGTWFITTPGSVTVHKTKNDLTVTCMKSGYQDAMAIIPSKFNGVTAGNILVGGLIGITVDAASGANYGYDELTEIPLIPVNSPGPPADATDVVPNDGPTRPTS
jgi:hypothetical protein